MPILMSSERALYLELRCRLSLRKHLVAAIQMRMNFFRD
jgi:hypothetical protein